MTGAPAESAEEIRRLQRCITDLSSVVALSAVWSGRRPAEIASTLLDSLLAMLNLDLAYIRLPAPSGEAPIELARVAPARRPTMAPEQLGARFRLWLGDDPGQWPPTLRHPLWERDLALVPMRLGVQDEIGMVVAGSQRTDFPRPMERLVLGVATNQAAIALQEAGRRGEQRRLAEELDRRVAERTAALAAANAELLTENAERERAERELRRSEALLAEGQRLAVTGTFAWRVATEEITWSDELYRIFGFDRGTPVSLARIGERVHPDDGHLLADMLSRAAELAPDFEYTHRLRMPDGSVKYLHLMAHARRDHDGAVEYLGAVQDVTERRRAEEALDSLRAELAHLARVTSLGALTASIAHEVNQPLAGIVTNASTCLRMLAAEPPNVEGALETARRTIRDSRRASDVITRLRALFERRALAPEPVDLGEAAREVIALSQGELQQARVIVRTEFAESLPAVTGDRVQLQQVVLNLLRNAVEAMRGVEGRPRLVLLRTELAPDDAVRLLVRDGGVGLDPATTPRLFEPFYTTKETGMGIGLSVSRTIIESHGGRLWAQPNDGPGATFAFSIPRALATLPDRARGAVAPATALAAGKPA